MIGYGLALLGYLTRRHRFGASDEHRLFPAVELPPVPGTPSLPRVEHRLTAEWDRKLTDTKTRAFRVVREGVVTRSWDAPGDEPGRPGRLYSITKSVLSMAWGAAEGEGRVPHLDDPVFHGLTPRHLLRMDSGIGFDEGFETLNRQVLTYLHPDARRVARQGRIEDPVGEAFHYNDFHSLLLGVLLEEGLERSGWRPPGPVAEPVAAWVWEKVLTPAGMEHPGRFVVDSKRHRFPKTESGLCLSADDVARIGLLVLRGSPWLETATDPARGWSGQEAFSRYRNLAWGPWLATGRGSYGLHWWMQQEASGPDTVFAMGIHGQLLVVSRKHRAVVVRLADRWALKGWWPDEIVAGLDDGTL